MTSQHHSHARILAIDPCTRGFGFAVLEGGTRLIDWGVARLYSKVDEEFLVRVDAIINRYKPTIIALEDVSGTHKSERMVKRINVLVGYARSCHIERTLVSGGEIRSVLGLAPDAHKHDVAATVTRLFPELAATLPPHRKPWQTEDVRMNVFDATGIAIGSANIASHPLAARCSRPSP